MAKKQKIYTKIEQGEMYWSDIVYLYGVRTFTNCTYEQVQQWYDKQNKYEMTGETTYSM